MSNLTSDQVPWSVSLADNTTLDLTYLVTATQKLQMTSNILNLYPYIEWVVNVPVSFVESGLLIVGSRLNFTFNDEKSKTQFVTSFYIDSIQYGQTSNDASAPITATFTLSTAYKFLDEIQCKAYYGNVREILEQLVNQELKLSGAVSTLNVVKGIDTPMKRFRTYQTTKDFIESRLADSYRGEEETFTYIFTDLANEMYAYHVKGALNELPMFYCFHEGNHNIEYLANLSKVATAAPYISMMQGMTVSVNPNGNLWQVANSGISMLYRTNTPKKLNDFPVFRMFPPMALGEEEMLPISSSKRKSYDHLSQVYIMDDQNDYSKEYTALTFLRNQDLFASLKIEVITDMNMNIKAGHICKLFPPSNKNESPIVASIFEGNWLISSVDHILQASKGKTHITLQATSLNQRGNRAYDSRFFRQEDSNMTAFESKLNKSLTGK